MKLITLVDMIFIFWLKWLLLRQFAYADDGSEVSFFFQSDHFVLSTNFLFKFNVSLPLVTGELLQNTVDVVVVTPHCDVIMITLWHH